MRALFALVAAAALSTACSSSPLAPTASVATVTPTAAPVCGAGPCAPQLPAGVRVEGAGGIVCVPLRDQYPQWEVYEPVDRQPHRLEVVATRATSPGCSSTADLPTTITPRGPFHPSEREVSTVFFLRDHLTDATGQACGRVRYELRVDGGSALWLVVDSGRACEVAR